MIEVSDILPPEILEWLVSQLRLYRVSGGHGKIELNIQDGHILTYSESHSHKASGRARIRTTTSKQ
jgi:hypothetical protein